MRSVRSAAVSNTVPLEDELGDVLEKALRRSGLNVSDLSTRAAVSPNAINDAINYRSELSAGELSRLAAVLKLNEVGLCALGCGQYPLPPLGPLPFSLHPLRMGHGIGVTNAYIVSDIGANSGVLFDTGPSIAALRAAWPRQTTKLDAIFLTHVEAEHAGGLCEAVEQFGAAVAYSPGKTPPACSKTIIEGDVIRYRGFDVTAFSTPGHSSAHNCYLIEATATTSATAVLVSGDLIFAGSIGGAGHCQLQLARNLKRMLERVPPKTILAPGHGPMTTVENELRFNPFLA